MIDNANFSNISAISWHCYFTLICNPKDLEIVTSYIQSYFHKKRWWVGQVLLYTFKVQTMNYHGRSSYQQKRVGIPLTNLTLPHFCACPKPGPGFPTSHHGLLSSVRIRGDCFVDIGGIDDHHCLNFFFIIGK
jgi:hypothetical protein